MIESALESYLMWDIFRPDADPKIQQTRVLGAIIHYHFKRHHFLSDSLLVQWLWMLLGGFSCWVRVLCAKLKTSYCFMQNIILGRSWTFSAFLSTSKKKFQKLCNHLNGIFEAQNIISILFCFKLFMYDFQIIRNSQCFPKISETL